MINDTPDDFIVPVSSTVRIYGNGSLVIGPGGEVNGRNVQFENRGDCFKIIVDESNTRRPGCATPSILTPTTSPGQTILEKRKRLPLIQFKEPIQRIALHGDSIAVQLDVIFTLKPGIIDNETLKIHIERARFTLSEPLKLEKLFCLHASSAAFQCEIESADVAIISLSMAIVGHVKTSRLILAAFDKSQARCDTDRIKSLVLDETSCAYKSDGSEFR